MYEKHGLMCKVRDPLVIAYLRSNADITNTDLVENALRRKLGIAEKAATARTRGNEKIPDCVNCVPVKIRDKRLINHIIQQKLLRGITQRHTVESAILEVIAGGK